MQGSREPFHRHILHCCIKDSQQLWMLHLRFHHCGRAISCPCIHASVQRQLLIAWLVLPARMHLFGGRVQIVTEIVVKAGQGPCQVLTRHKGGQCSECQEHGRFQRQEAESSNRYGHRPQPVGFCMTHGGGHNTCSSPTDTARW